MAKITNVRLMSRGCVLFLYAIIYTILLNIICSRNNPGGLLVESEKGIQLAHTGLYVQTKVV